MSINDDKVNSPKHYSGTCSLSCIEVMRVTFGDEPTAWFCICNSFKYLWRYKNKNGDEDLKKAKWYLDYVNEMIEDDCIFTDEIRKYYLRLLQLYERAML